MTDAERYAEWLELLSRGLIRYAEKRGLLEQVPVDLKDTKAVDLLETEEP